MILNLFIFILSVVMLFSASMTILMTNKARMFWSGLTCLISLILVWFVEVGSVQYYASFIAVIFSVSTFVLTHYGIQEKR